MMKPIPNPFVQIISFQVYECEGKYYKTIADGDKFIEIAENQTFGLFGEVGYVFYYPTLF